jgi:hypothetical protein
MRLVHLNAGIATVVIFLITGQFMRHHTPPIDTLADSVRLLHRSRHIYILAAGLVNLMLGIYLRLQPRGWRNLLQRIGSAFLVVSPALLVAAFAIEPEAGFRTEMPWSSLGLYALFAGCSLHFLAAAGSHSRPLDRNMSTAAGSSR